MGPGEGGRSLSHIARGDMQEPIGHARGDMQEPTADWCKRQYVGILCSRGERTHLGPLPQPPRQPHASMRMLANSACRAARGICGVAAAAAASLASVEVAASVCSISRVSAAPAFLHVLLLQTLSPTRVTGAAVGDSIVAVQRGTARSRTGAIS
jgi:hypothetical protein